MSEKQLDYETEKKKISGFESPNYTQTPNDFFAMIPDMGEAELRVTLVMIRQTFGFHRDDFKMGVGKLARAAGLSRQGALDGANQAEDRGTFYRTNPNAQGEAMWALSVPLNQVDTPIQPVEGSPQPVGGQVGVKESINKDSKKGDLVDGILEYTLKPKSIRDALAKHFHLTPNFETKYNRQWMQWAIENEVTEAQIETAANLYRRDKRFNWRQPELKNIQEHWLALTEETSSPETDSPVYIPPPENPNAMTYEEWMKSKETK